MPDTYNINYTHRQICEIFYNGEFGVSPDCPAKTDFTVLFGLFGTFTLKHAIFIWKQDRNFIWMKNNFFSIIRMAKKGRGIIFDLN